MSGVDGRRGVDGPEQRSLWERCVTRGLPYLPDFYSNNFLILQTPDNMVTLMEMIHEPRLIPRTVVPHPHLAVGQWLGDSRGRWEEDDDPFEYACHEGNYAMVNVLAVGRSEEQVGRR